MAELTASGTIGAATGTAYAVIPYVSMAEIRDHVETDLRDEGLQLLLDAAIDDVSLYAPGNVATAAKKKRAIIQLVRLAVEHDGLASSTIGDYSRTSAGGGERARILAPLRPVTYGVL